jgi:hypothetical protein
MSVTLDTNEYVSALQFAGRASLLLGMAKVGTLSIDISDHIEQELLRVLREDSAGTGIAFTSWGNISGLLLGASSR